MTKVLIDTEFNGFGGELISMALVTPGSEFYEVLPTPAVIDPWVAENVMPVLQKAPISIGDFRLKLLAFLRKIDSPVIVADWPSDLERFFSALLGRSHAETVSMPIRAELVSLPEYDSAVPHNALEDARAIMRALNGYDSTIAAED